MEHTSSIKKEILAKINAYIANCTNSLYNRMQYDGELVSAMGAVRATKVILEDLRDFIEKAADEGGSPQ